MVADTVPIPRVALPQSLPHRNENIGDKTRFQGELAPQGVSIRAFRAVSAPLLNLCTSVPTYDEHAANQCGASHMTSIWSRRSVNPGNFTGLEVRRFAVLAGADVGEPVEPAVFE